MTKWTVSSASELQNALNQASGGDRIELKSGQYGSFTIKNMDFASKLTIISENKNDPAEFTSVSIKGSSNIRVDSVHVNYPDNPVSAAQMVTIDNGSENIEFANSEVNARVDNIYSGGRGLYSGDASNVLFENNYVHDVKDGGVFLGTDGLKVIGNRFDDVRKDGMKFAGTDGVLVENNTGPTRYHPESGDHQDFIQFQGATSNAVIRGNVLLPGDLTYSQGIFLDDAVYSNILIENNVIYNGLIRGISLGTDSGGSSGITVLNNTVLTIPGFGHNASTILVPSGSVIKNNVTSTNGEGSIGENIAAQYTDPNGVAYYNDLYVNAMAGVGITIEDLRPVEGGPADFGSGMGAEQRIFELLEGSGGQPGNNPPDANDDAVDVDEDASITIDGSQILANDSDADGDPFSIISVGQASNGTAVLNGNGSITYTPDADFAGSDSFTYTIRDSKGGSATATVSVEVNPYDDPPKAKNDSASTEIDSAVTINALANDSDPDGDALTITAFAQPNNGTVSLNQNGSFTYTPNKGFEGTDSFQYTLSDGNGGQDTALVSVEVREGLAFDPLLSLQSQTFGGSIGDAVILPHEQEYLLGEGTLAIRFSADDVSGRHYLFSKDSSYFDTGGHLGVYIEDGKVTVRLQSESDSFTVTAPASVSANQSHHVAVTFGDGGLKLYLDGSLVASNSYQGGLLGNLEPIVIGAGQESSGDLVADKLKDAFDGTIEHLDLFGESLSANEVALLAGSGGGQDNTDPIATDDEAAIGGDGTASIDVRANDSDVDGDQLAIESFTQGAHGSVRLESDGSFTYTQDPGYFGPDSFAYVISDGKGGLASATVTVTRQVAIGSDEDDSFVGSSLSDRFFGADGDDVATGDLAADVLHGDSGSDILKGERGSDTLRGGTGNDTLQGGWHDDSFFGHGGSDQLFGGRGLDRFFGGTGRDEIYGGSGDDVVFGGIGTDTVWGGSGDDRVTVFFDDDKVIEEEDGGFDRVFVEADRYTLAENVEVMVSNQDGEKRLLYTNTGGAQVTGNSARDTIYGQSGSDTMYGGQNIDYLYGGDGDDVLRGRSGRDELYGGAGADTLDGRGDEERADQLFGGRGQDLLVFNDTDTVFGGSGSDRFGFRFNEDGALQGGTRVAQLVIGDFESNLFDGSTAQDKFVYAPGLTPKDSGIGQFSYIESASFSGGNAQARFNEALGQVEIDTDGDKALDVAFILLGMTAANQLTATDFIF